MYIIKLDSKQLVFEALSILRENAVDTLPVYEGSRFIADISREEITDFLNHLDNGKNIYYHKLNFDLGTALIRIREQRSKPKKLSNVFIRVAVIAFTILGLAWFFFSNTHSQQPSSFQSKASRSLANNVILPGSNKATLTLGNGTSISLSEAKTGVVVDASGLTYNDNTAVIQNGTSSSYLPENSGHHGNSGRNDNSRHLDNRRDLLNNTDKRSLPYGRDDGGSQIGAQNNLIVATPRGGQYQITLPDGTKVWLNAASKLKFPSSFTGAAQRKVDLSGEAYFEVTKDKKHPFIVISNEQQVEVLGTHFNISSYTDEDNIKTTLLEGSVAVRNPGSTMQVTLKPGQQSNFTTNKPIVVKQVDANDAIAWKNGKFAFRNESLESIMNKVARWYDVEIVYQNNEISKEILGGSFTRSEGISEILKTLELVGDVHFKIQDRKIIVTN
nr:FecR domain-containing protein [Pedobacter panaciterrae]